MCHDFPAKALLFMRQNIMVTANMQEHKSLFEFQSFVCLCTFFNPYVFIKLDLIRYGIF